MTSAILTRFTQPEYTGENRCLPCTVVNVGIAAAGSALLALWSPFVGLAAFVASALIIYVRGYLVPGTPELTKRYLPARIHRLFGTHGPAEPTAKGPIDIEAELTAEGIIVDDSEDLTLNPSFHAAWDNAIARVSEESLMDSLSAFLETDQPLLIEEDGTRTMVFADGAPAGNWESQAALIADVAAHQTLISRFPNYLEYDRETRARMVGAVRMFLEACPTCGGDVEIGEEVVKSCCRAFDVVAFSCRDCGVRLAEFELLEAEPA
ncbi:hypothetical protein [Haladaptatus sp. DJG-WS-42]|uniref:hypothetical protein n=1 Tax=Haladaptatus sp. DJG-WS-42 TaxID=3120516 RepID=UPI0030CDE34C